MWLAGGGIKPGATIGDTDDLGFKIAEDPIHVHDLQATMLHCLGMDHTRLTYKHMGRDFRLTDVAGTVVKRCWLRSVATSRPPAWAAARRYTRDRRPKVDDADARAFAMSISFSHA